jgi:hypothetical protein
VLKDLEGRDIDEEMLAVALENPAAKLKYVLASSRPLADEFVQLLSSSGGGQNSAAEPNMLTCLSTPNTMQRNSG